MSKALMLAAITVAAGVVTTVVLNTVAPITQEEEGFDEPIAAEKIFQGAMDPSAAQLANASPSMKGASEGNVAQHSGEKEIKGGACARSRAKAKTGPSMEGDSGKSSSEHFSEKAKSSGCSRRKSKINPTTEGVSGIGNPQRSKGKISGGSCSRDKASAPLDQPIVVGSALTGGALPEDPFPAPKEEPQEEPQVFVAESSPPESSGAPATANSVDEIQPSTQAARPPKSAPKPAPRAAVLPDVPPPETQQIWWPAPLKDELNVSYVGAASFTTAIVILFDGEFENADQINQFVAVNTQDGDAVKGRWVVAKNNPNMLLYGVEPGIYRVRIGAGITDKDGRAMNRTFGGSLFVR